MICNKSTSNNLTRISSWCLLILNLIKRMVHKLLDVALLATKLSLTLIQLSNCFRLEIMSCQWTWLIKLLCLTKFNCIKSILTFWVFVEDLFLVGTTIIKMTIYQHVPVIMLFFSCSMFSSISRVIIINTTAIYLVHQFRSVAFIKFNWRLITLGDALSLIVIVL